MPSTTVPATAGGFALSDQDRRLLEMVASGLDRQALAAATGWTPATVSRRLGDLRGALGARTNVHAVVLALRQGLID